jgi:hypothetical protein
LTGIGNDTCRIDLYIFGPERAEIPNFSVERCARPLYPAIKDEVWYRGLDQLRIRHPGLRTLVDQSPAATKLTAVLNSKQMKEDAYIIWSPFGEKRLVFFSAHGAAILAANITVTLLVAALLTLYWFSGREGRRAQRIRKCCVMSLWGALLI